MEHRTQFWSLACTAACALAAVLFLLPSLRVDAALTQYFAVGDSIALGLIGKNIPGSAKSGWNAQAILNQIIPGIQNEALKGRTIVLSSGASNNPNVEFIRRFVPQQIDALKAKGATDIILLGVGSRYPAEVNAALMQIAQQKGVRFSNLPPTNKGDGVHPNPSELVKTLTGATGITPDDLTKVATTITDTKVPPQSLTGPNMLSSFFSPNSQFNPGSQNSSPFSNLSSLFGGQSPGGGGMQSGMPGGFPQQQILYGPVGPQNVPLPGISQELLKQDGTSVHLTGARPNEQMATVKIENNVRPKALFTETNTEKKDDVRMEIRPTEKVLEKTAAASEDAFENISRALSRLSEMLRALLSAL